VKNWVLLQEKTGTVPCSYIERRSRQKIQAREKKKSQKGKISPASETSRRRGEEKKKQRTPARVPKRKGREEFVPCPVPEKGIPSPFSRGGGTIIQ